MSACATRWGIAAALALYALGGAMLVAQKPGLQYDEALLVEGAVQLRHSRAEIALAHSPNTWACSPGRCFPVMGEGPYIGAVKDYLSLPLFALFGPRTWVARLAAMLLAMIGIWGLARLMAQQVSPGAGIAAGLILAVNPAYLNMTVFDNGVVAPMMAGLGLICAAVAMYLRRSGVPAAFLIGAAAGFALWARANFLWTLVGAAAAALIVFHRHLRVPISHALAMAVGGIAGGAPLLYYEFESGGGTFRTMQDYTVQGSLLKLLPLRLFWLADTLVSDGEHRVMWSAMGTARTMEQLPSWQLWLFPSIVLGAAIVCVLTMFTRDPEPWRAGPFAVIALVLSGGFLFTSHLPITEHHLIALVPLAVVVVVLGCAFLQHQWRWGGAISGALALVYLGCAGYWQSASVQGLRRTGGVGVWSSAVVDVARTLDREYSGREIKIMDWGYQTSLFVLMDGRLGSVELTAEGGEADHSYRGRTWPDEIREGGVFLVSGPHVRTFAPKVESFLRAWAAAEPVTRVRRFTERDGTTYAELLDIEPNSIKNGASEVQQRHPTLSMNDPAVDQLASGFFDLQPGGWRWSKPDFLVKLNGPDLPGTPVELSLQVFLPEQNIQTLGAITLSAAIDGHALPPETYRQAGQYRFTRPVPADWVSSGLNRLEFHIDKPLGPGPADPRALGIVVSAVSLEAQ
jgi:hypothetical protein